MQNITVHYDNGTSIQTQINGNKDTINEYYLGKTFNIGDGENDLMAKAVSVDFERDTLRAHELYELCRRAHYWTSYSPDERGDSEIRYYLEILAEFKTLCKEDSERYEDIAAKFKRKFIAHMNAKSRCASSAITGGSGFNVARAENANASEHKRGEEVLEFVEKVRKRIDRENNPSTDISSDDKGAVSKLKAKLEKLETNHTKMKHCNAIIRRKIEDSEKIDLIAELLATDKEKAAVLLEPDFCGRVGFASYQLTNNNATIKNTKARIAQLEKQAERVTQEEEIKGVRVLHNTEENRLQLFFDGKPDAGVRSELKSKGFKWSPRFGAWQRMLNGNAIFSAQLFFRNYEAS